MCHHVRSVYFFVILFFIPFQVKNSWRDKFVAKSRLTLARIDAIQNFFGKAIRKNKGNPQNMAKAIWAILDH